MAILGQKKKKTGIFPIMPETSAPTPTPPTIPTTPQQLVSPLKQTLTPSQPNLPTPPQNLPAAPTPKSKQGRQPVNWVINPDGTRDMNIGTEHIANLTVKEFDTFNPTMEEREVTPKTRQVIQALINNNPTDLRLSKFAGEVQQANDVRIAEIAKEIGQIGILPQEEALPPEASTFGQAIERGAEAAAGTAATIGTGALALGLPTSGTSLVAAGGTIAAAGAAAFTYTLFSAQGKLRKQTVKEAKEAVFSKTGAARGLVALQNDINKGLPISASEARFATNNFLEQIRQSERILKRETARSNDAFTGQAGDELKAIYRWYDSQSTSGTRDLARLKFELEFALQNPNAQKVMELPNFLGTSEGNSEEL